MSNPKTIVLSLLLIFGGLIISRTALQAQSFELLKDKWLHAKSDTARVNAGLELYNKYYRDNYDSIYSQSTLMNAVYNLAKKINYPQGIIKSSYGLGESYTIHSIPAKAVEYYYISIKASEKWGDEVMLAKARMGIGLIYYTQNNWVKAIEFFRSSQNINKRIKQTKSVGIQQYLIGSSLYNLHQYKSAKLYLDSALKIKFDTKDSQGINECRLVLADIYKGQKNYDSALKYYSELLPIYLSQSEFIPVSLIYTSLAEISYAHKNYHKALTEANKAYEYSLLIPYPIAKLKASEVLNKIYTSIGDYKKALHYYKRHSTLKDSIENSDFASQLSVANATYEFEKEQTAIKEQQNKKDLKHKLELDKKSIKQTISTIIAIIAIFILIIGVFAYRWVSKQKKISEDLLLNILPMQTVMELKNYGKSIPKIHQGVTIMFCDIKNFSQIAEKLSPEAIVEMLDTYFRQFDIISEKFGIEKIKTIGDAYMCAGGLGSDDNWICNTIDAALEFLAYNDSIESEMHNKFNHAFYFRVGIHTGNVVSGVVGLKKYSYDIWGDAVNVAARMEQNSEPGKINISGNTYNLIKDKGYNFNYRGQIPIKNLGKTDMYFVERN